MVNKDVPVVEANSRELRAITHIAVLDNSFEQDGQYLEKRLRSVPDLYRQYRIAKAAMSKALSGLYDTLPLSSLLRLQKTCANSEVLVRPKTTLAVQNDSLIVLQKDMTTLINAAMSAQCAVCLKVGKETKKCELRKCLLNIVPPEEIDNTFMCEYAKVASESELGNYLND